MTVEIGVDSSVGRLRRVAMRRPGAILHADAERWHYSKPIVADRLVAQYDEFADLVASSGAEVLWLPDDASDDLADSVFTYDPSFVVGDGAVIGRLGKPVRAAESELHAAFYRAHDIDIIGAIEAPGTFEGGDCFWLDATTLVVGRGFRTNQAGIAQLATLAARRDVTVEAYDLPYHRGPAACLHLMSVISPLDVDLAIVHPPLMPTALHQRMVDAGYTLLEAPADEFEASGGLSINVLATAPRELIAISGFDATLQLMRDAGCSVSTFAADELCLPCEGGPTCLTRPILRERVR